MLASYTCAVCGEEIETVVDESQGLSQAYIEDCQVCCRPNVLRVQIDPETDEITIDASFEE
ncbi:MAG: CPXCG motif-containing cysteine-rich protein [Bacteroidota bacterium]|nr:CPXCG motif-containing cysteine-rich protein [Bacteroidota bacterium]MDP4231965.1 CPXCG motif-containing cysteine-rich protein [Bacteroidota bacterium]MDP4241328.1 CPXCG motif-containing cysteine-rich protein [Bacteroidota bacterium]MDP4287249.1 CPXCG motif-containing cysteine-rich protein [Bacteroidota bacterium]